MHPKAFPLTSETYPRTPATMKSIKITLDAEQSEILADAGADAFVIIGRGSYPHSAGRFELWIVPSTVKAIDSAVRVATGQSAERRIKTAIRQAP